MFKMVFQIGHRGTDVKETMNKQNGNLILLTSDYSNFLTGKKWSDFYYGMLKNGTTDKNILWKDTFTSENAETSAPITTGNYVKEIDIDFDATIQVERIIGGFAKINVSGTVAILDSPSGKNSNAYFVMKVVKYDGTTETTLGSSQSPTFTVTSDGTTGSTTQSMNYNGLIELTRTGFSKKDILRLTLEIWAKTETVDAASKVTLDHNATKKIEIPFARLDEY